MRLSAAAGSVQIVATGIIAGIFVSFIATAPARLSLEASSFVQLQQGIHVVFGKLMPPLVMTSILSGLVWMIFLRKHVRSLSFFLLVISTGCSVAAFILTVTLNFPLNDLLMTWTAAAPPTNVKELWMPWENAHTSRTIIYVVAFISAITANGIARKES